VHRVVVRPGPGRSLRAAPLARADCGRGMAGGRWPATRLISRGPSGTGGAPSPMTASTGAVGSGWVLSQADGSFWAALARNNPSAIAPGAGSSCGVNVR
jgi:hypothetical protein